MRRRLVGHLMLVAVLAVAGMSCRRRHTLNIQYVPSSAPGPALRAKVFVQVVDQRPPDRGGLDPRRVGWVRGNYGIPKPMRVAENTVSRNVWMATADALAQLGIGASAGPNKLLATVLEFWEDGVGGSGSHVRVRYQLFDAAGRERWAATVESGGSAPGDPSSPPPAIATAPEGRTYGMFGYALGMVAARARVQFATAAFQEAIARAQ
jgi:hypothetical protein